MENKLNSIIIKLDSRLAQYDFFHGRFGALLQETFAPRPGKCATMWKKEFLSTRDPEI